MAMSWRPFPGEAMMLYPLFSTVEAKSPVIRMISTSPAVRAVTWAVMSGITSRMKPSFFTSPL